MSHDCETDKELNQAQMFLHNLNFFYGFLVVNGMNGDPISHLLMTERS